MRNGRFFRAAGSAACLVVLAYCGTINAIGRENQPEPTRKGVIGMAANMDRGLVNFDARLVNDLVGPDAALAVARYNAKLNLKARAEAMARLASIAPGVVTEDDPMFGTPQFLRSTRAWLTGPNPGAGVLDIAAAFVQDYFDLFNVSSAEVRAGRVIRNYRTDHNGVTHLTVQQQIGGVDLFGCELRANVTSSGQLMNISSTLLERPAGDFATPKPVIDDAAAVVLAAAANGVAISADVMPAGDGVGAEKARQWMPVAELRANERVTTRLVYFPVTRDDIRPAWLVVVPVKGIGHTYDTMIDATTGALLWRHNHLEYFTPTQPITFRVYTSTSPRPGSPGTSTPTGFQFPEVPRQLVTVDPASIAAINPNGWINDGNTETLGNNVDAHTDLNADNIADVPRPNGGAGRVFDFPLDLTAAPSTYSNAATTQLFYWSNVYHDRLYGLGFNEAAGNFQTDNFGRGGTAGDAVQADAQDGSGTDNANFATSGADGSSARVQMYIFTAPTPDRDGSLDGDVVFHELTHGTSIRLHRGLTANQSRGMGEGWSDFVGLCLNSHSGDDPNGVYPSGAYASYLIGGGVNNYYFGIRRFPYCTDLNKNPLTFADIDPNQFSVPASVPRGPIGSATASEVHNVGEVWCNMLVECRAALMTSYGFAGNERILQLVIDGMKLSVTDPTFVQSRDAILQADLVDYSGVDQPGLWTAFARRGIGFGAVAPASSTTAGVVESYSTPQYVTFTYPDGLPTQIQPGVVTTFRVDTAPTGLTLVSDSGKIFYSINGAPYTNVSMGQVSDGHYLASIPAQSCFANVSYYTSVDTSLGTRTDPGSAPTAARSASVYSSVNVLVSDDFETATPWTVGPNTATTGLWVRGDPNGTAAQPEDDHTPTGVNCWFTGQAAVGAAVGTNDVDGGYTTLVSPAFDLHTVADATVSYWRWYSNGTGSAPYADTFRVDVSLNGGSTWTSAEVVGPGSAADPNVNPGWRFASWTFSSLGLTPTSQVKVRFVADDAGTGSIVEAAIDDFQIVATVCTPPAPTCLADIVSIGGAPPPDGLLTGDDFNAFISAFATGDLLADVVSIGGAPPADGLVTGDDFNAFIAAFAAGCP